MSWYHRSYITRTYDHVTYKDSLFPHKDINLFSVVWNVPEKAMSSRYVNKTIWELLYTYIASETEMSDANLQTLQTVDNLTISEWLKVDKKYFWIYQLVYTQKCKYIGS